MQDHLFSPAAPLPQRLRPSSFEEFHGQQSLIDQLAGKKPHSMILYGPPGCGKTTLALLLAKKATLPFRSLSAVASGVKELRDVIEEARKTGRILLFVDEIHRFSKSQQDALLHAVEEGWLVLIGATTENPSFEVISPLLSRCQVYKLGALSSEDLDRILERALMQDSLLKGKTIEGEQYEHENEGKSDDGDGEDPVEAEMAQGLRRDEGPADGSDTDEREVHPPYFAGNFISGIPFENDIETHPNQVDEDDHADENDRSEPGNGDFREERTQDDEANEENREETDLPDGLDRRPKEKESYETERVGDEIEDADIVILDGAGEIAREHIDEGGFGESEEKGKEVDELCFRDIEIFAVEHSEIISDIRAYNLSLRRHLSRGSRPCSRL
jgi:adenylate kinase family enzyme